VADQPKHPAAPKPASRRGRKPAAADERKDRVIQARVPEDLEHTLKQAAEKRRMSVSHLIRNVLEDTFTLVDHIVADSSALVEQVSRDAKRVAASVRGEADVPTPHQARSNPAQSTQDQAQDQDEEPDHLSRQAVLDSVDAWQDVIVNRPGYCIECNRELKRGQRAWRGLSPLLNQGNGPVWLCPECLEQL